METGDQPGADAYGIEVEVAGVWIQLGTQVVSWPNVGGKPSVYPPEAHTHPGSDVTSKVASATAADSATTASQADGVTPAAFARDLAGVPGSFKAVWMHSNGTLGFNTSTERGKTNIQSLRVDDPYAILELQESVYDRRAFNGDEYTPIARTGEVGLIAEQVDEVEPRLVVREEDGTTAGVRYDLLALYLLPAMRENRKRIAQLESTVTRQGILLEQLAKTLGVKP